jgi:hypothetical protein
VFAQLPRQTWQVKGAASIHQDVFLAAQQAGVGKREFQGNQLGIHTVGRLSVGGNIAGK